MVSDLGVENAKSYVSIGYMQLKTVAGRFGAPRRAGRGRQVMYDSTGRSGNPQTTRKIAVTGAAAVRRRAAYTARANGVAHQ